tara:strand:+ start:311 stop:526 length:216 start_codon:yes stop_codon:yes gene_type:complete
LTLAGNDFTSCVIGKHGKIVTNIGNNIKNKTVHYCQTPPKKSQFTKQMAQNWRKSFHRAYSGFFLWSMLPI